MKRVIQFLNQLPRIDGKVWVTLWGIVALVRFALGQPIDSVFLGVLGIYGGTKIASKIVGKGGANE